MTCTSCQSDEWRLASLVYKEGLSEIRTRTKGSAVSVSGSGGLGFGMGTARTKGVQQSAISKAAAPPKTFIITRLCAVAVVLSGVGEVFYNGTWYLGYAVIVAAVAGAVVTFPSEKRKRDIAMAKWQATRMCQRCGTLYLPATA